MPDSGDKETSDKEKSAESSHGRIHKLLDGLTTVQRVLVGVTGVVIAAGALIAAFLGVVHELPGQKSRRWFLAVVLDTR